MSSRRSFLQRLRSLLTGNGGSDVIDLSEFRSRKRKRRELSTEPSPKPKSARRKATRNSKISIVTSLALTVSLTGCAGITRSAKTESLPPQYIVPAPQLPERPRGGDPQEIEDGSVVLPKDLAESLDVYIGALELLPGHAAAAIKEQAARDEERLQAALGIKEREFATRLAAQEPQWETWEVALVALSSVIAGGIVGAVIMGVEVITK